MRPHRRHESLELQRSCSPSLVPRESATCGAGVVNPFPRADPGTSPIAVVRVIHHQNQSLEPQFGSWSLRYYNISVARCVARV